MSFVKCECASQHVWSPHPLHTFQVQGIREYRVRGATLLLHGAKLGANRQILKRGAKRWLSFSKLTSGKKVLKKVKSWTFLGDPPTLHPNCGPSYFFTPWAAHGPNYKVRTDLESSRQALQSWAMGSNTLKNAPPLWQVGKESCNCNCCDYVPGSWKIWCQILARWGLTQINTIFQIQNAVQW